MGYIWSWSSKTDLFSAVQIRSLLNSYIAKNNLVNVNDQAYINLDGLLYFCVSAKSQGKAKGKDAESSSGLSRFSKRDELTKNIIEKMQSWHVIRAKGKDPVTKSEKKNPDPLSSFVCSQRV